MQDDITANVCSFTRQGVYHVSYSTSPTANVCKVASVAVVQVSGCGDRQACEVGTDCAGLLAWDH
jgi:hypothetical protein